MGVLEQISQMKNQGMQNNDIVATLQKQAISPKPINDALSKAENKNIYDILQEARANQSSGIIDASHREIGKDFDDKMNLEIDAKSEFEVIEILEE